MSLYVDIEKDLSSFKLKVEIKQEKGTLGFLGESGSGKSMTLKCIAGLEKPTRGKIVLNDRVLFDSEKKINLSTQDRKVGFLFQNYALFPHMTVSKNIELGLLKLSKSEKKEIVARYLDILKLNGFEGRYPWQLSGGQQQRVALARALATSPDILLLDEPFSALDHHLRSNMEKELMNMLKDYKGDILFVTHDIEEAYRVCDDIIVYNKGEGLPKRPKKELFESPKYLIEAKITGCKNISKLNRLDKNTIYATDWGCELTLNREIGDNIEYVGIREHHIKVLDSNEDLNEKLCFELINIVENPFTYTIYVRKTDLSNECVPIQIELEKSKMRFKKGDRIYLDFPQEYLFCFRYNYNKKE
ncbi:sulfate/molybdate ABC transporter ATP-binding protein [Clostridioides difficile]|nr:sulfate/molybdate ABC transporter ATP-binding protein [Clostridioides difficile]